MKPPFEIHDPEKARREAQEAFDEISRLSVAEWVAIALGGVALAWIVFDWIF